MQNPSPKTNSYVLFNDWTKLIYSTLSAISQVPLLRFFYVTT